jgi:DNA helicase-2/ATP-dependent DNA helicase PcrA
MTQTGCAKPAFGTFHSVFFMILKLAYRYDAGSIVREEQRVEFLRELLRRYEIETEDESEFISGVLSEISMVKGEMIGVEHYYAKSCSADVFRRLYKGYEAALRGAGLLDFDDMLVMCRELFDQRADILQAWQRKYRYILIDEFQDINRIQYEVIRMMALPENNLFIVGDDDQSIYRFRGARPEIMLGFEKDYPGTEKILLDQNYRSTEQIIGAAGRLIDHNKTRFSKDITAVRGPGRSVVAKEFADPGAEARAIAAQLRDYVRLGVPYEDIAVLYRTNIGPRRLVEVLMEYNIPFHMRDKLPNLYEHWIARDILAYLRAAAGDMSRANLLRIVNRPIRYISRDALDGKTISLEAVKSFYQDREWMVERVEQLEYDLKNIRTLPPGKAVNYIRKAVGYDDYLREYAGERQLDPEELREVLDQLQESAMPHASLEEWETYMENYRRKLEEQAASRQLRQEGVHLMTMHSSKGLEFRVVFILDANEGVTPHHKAALAADLEEERRMFYVAMTRAKDRLHVYYVKERYHKKQAVSRFVEEAEII